ncbi:hypothetical protein F0562_034887 [Nyssa sinensis]|uniref:Uncharacterized protein n=1 Tax=Nyssa sinensis TaxID=561372 RepID=A0A5J5ABG4_9ASTE|nr:hypothetical protein F0562_034887 [Nyssa sinensis]
MIGHGVRLFEGPVGLGFTPSLSLSACPTLSSSRLCLSPHWFLSGGALRFLRQSPRGLSVLLDWQVTPG